MQLENCNKYNIPAKQWRKWDKNQRLLFNRVYSEMIGNQEIFIHPKAKKIPISMWETTVWNAAWVAADVMRTISRL